MAVTVRTRKVVSNPLLKRKQMVVDIKHNESGTVSRADVKAILAKKFKVQNDATIFVFGFKTDFGGKQTTGFACIYDSLEDALDCEPNFRLRRAGHLPARTGSRKLRRESKNKRLKLRGTEKDKGKRKRKSAGDDE